MLNEWKNEKAEIEKEMAFLSAEIAKLRGSRTHASVRYEFKLCRIQLAARRSTLRQRINKLESEQELLKIVNGADLTDDEKARYLATLRKLQALRVT